MIGCLKDLRWCEERMRADYLAALRNARARGYHGRLAVRDARESLEDDWEDVLTRNRCLVVYGPRGPELFTPELDP